MCVCAQLHSHALHQREFKELFELGASIASLSRRPEVPTNGQLSTEQDSAVQSKADDYETPAKALGLIDLGNVTSLRPSLFLIALNFATRS